MILFSVVEKISSILNVRSEEGMCDYEQTEFQSTPDSWSSSDFSLNFVKYSYRELTISFHLPRIL